MSSAGVHGLPFGRGMVSAVFDMSDMGVLRTFVASHTCPRRGVSHQGAPSGNSQLGVSVWEKVLRGTKKPRKSGAGSEWENLDRKLTWA